MKNFDKVRSELGKQFGGGAVFSEWEREFGIANTSLPVTTEEEATVYYKKVEDVIKAVFETIHLSEETDAIVNLIKNYISYKEYDTEKIKNILFLYVQRGKEFTNKVEHFEDFVLDELYNELLYKVLQIKNDFYENKIEDILHNSSVKGEEFNKIINSLPLYKIIMINIINTKF